MILGPNPTSVIYRFLLLNGSNNGLTGVSYATAGLQISVVGNSVSAPTSYTSLAGTIEAVGTCGTYVAPTTGKVRLGEVSASSCPGLYEIQLSNASWLGVSSLDISLTGVTGQRDYHETIQTLNLPVDVESINDSTQSADNLQASALSMIIGSVDSFVYTPQVTQFDTSLTDSSTGTYAGRVLIFTSGSLTRQAKTVQAYQLVSGRGRVVTDPYTNAPSGSDQFIIL